MATIPRINVIIMMLYVFSYLSYGCETLSILSDKSTKITLLSLASDSATVDIVTDCSALRGHMLCMCGTLLLFIVLTEYVSSACILANKLIKKT